MNATNLTRGAVLHKHVNVARTISEKSEGLLTRGADAALFFKTRWGVHTFGMRFPIDCLVLDDGGVLVSFRENLAPGRFFFWNPRYRNVLELPAGTLARTGTQAGDVIAMSA
jgi:hypothetical protein